MAKLLVEDSESFHEKADHVNPNKFLKSTFIQIIKP